MRGYNRNKSDLQSHVTPTLSREQLAELAQQGFPSPVRYAVQGGPLPVNLRRAEEANEEA